EHEVDMPGDKITDRPGSTAVRHDIEARVGLLLEEHACDMSQAALAAAALRRLVRDGPQPIDQNFHVIRRHGLSADNHKRGRSNGCDRLEVVYHIIGKRQQGAVDDMGDQTAKAERVTIWRSTRDATGADAPRRAGHIFDDDRLPERSLYPL